MLYLGHFSYTYCTSLRGTSSRSCRVYTAAPEEEDREGWDLEPFLTFGD
jgi:hypothetical protein